MNRTQGSVSVTHDPTSDRTTAETGPDHDQILAQLERLRMSREFEANDRRRAFLTYVVEETLAGRSERLKGYSIGQAVFERGDDFDAQSDPVVRLEARRLRRDLDGYYVSAGAHDPVRISIPKGGYVPQFEWHGGMNTPHGDADGGPARSDGAASLAGIGGAGPERASAHPPNGSTRGRRTTWAVLAVCVVAAAVFLAIRWVKPAQDPLIEGGFAKVAVLPFETTSDSENAGILASGLSWEVVQNLKGFDGLRVFQPFGAADGSSLTAHLQETPGASYLVRGNVMTTATSAEISVQLLDAVSNEVLWTERYAVELSPGSIIAARDAISGEIATLIAQPYGPLARNVLKSSAGFRPGSMDSYLCVLQAHEYRRAFSAAKFPAVLRCLEETVQRQPDYSDAWALLGWQHLDAARYEFLGRDKRAEEFSKALDAANRAVELWPENTLALKALSSIHHHMGNYAEGERLARQALELNPYDPDSLAQLGWRLAIRGNFEEGVPYLQDAIRRSVAPPGWYYHLISVHLLMTGQYDEMLRVSEQAAVDGGEFSIALVAMAAAGLGDRDLTRNWLAKLDPDALFSRNPEAFIRNHGAVDEVLAALMTGLDKARALAAKE